MVTKSRVLTTLSPPLMINHQDYGPRWASYVHEVMTDSSVSGSARTEVDAVDRFLADPNNTRARGFYRALQESNRSAGDAGIAEFHVFRELNTWTTCSGFFNGVTPGVTYPIENFAVRWLSDYEWPIIPTFAEKSSLDLKADGQHLYLSAIPNRDQADLGTVIAEIAVNPIQALAIPGMSLHRALNAKSWRRWAVDGTLTARARDRHRRIAGLPLEEARAAADDYLAYIFGVRPTINSLDALASSINKSRQSAELVVRNSRDGNFDPKRMRRKRRIPQKVSEATVTRAVRLSADGAQGLSLVGPATYHHESTQDVWFSSSFRMDTSDTSQWLDKCSDFFRSVDRVTGLGLDLRVAWDLIPFSFMVDWFANTGDLLEERQLRADYNIVCEYGYVMCHTRDLRNLHMTGMFDGDYIGAGGSHATVTHSKTVETKQRARCDSFGFQTDFSALNSFQWGALTALGLSFAAGHAPGKRS